jgi:excisionase family DNA binding protein
LRTIKSTLPSSERRAFTVEEVAQKFGVHPASIYRTIREGKLKPLAAFRRTLISDQELDRFLSTTKE